MSWEEFLKRMGCFNPRSGLFYVFCSVSCYFPPPVFSSWVLGPLFCSFQLQKLAILCFFPDHVKVQVRETGFFCEQGGIFFSTKVLSACGSFPSLEPRESRNFRCMFFTSPPPPPKPLVRLVCISSINHGLLYHPPERLAIPRPGAICSPPPGSGSVFVGSQNCFFFFLQSFLPDGCRHRLRPPTSVH